MTRKTWQVRVADPAEYDLEDILEYTIATFGDRQARIYEETVLAAVQALGDGPDIIGSKRRDDVAADLRTLHVARRGRRGSHLLLFRVEPPRTIRVLRILHDGMDLARHLPPEA